MHVKSVTCLFNIKVLTIDNSGFLETICILYFLD